MWLRPCRLAPLQLARSRPPPGTDRFVQLRCPLTNEGEVTQLLGAIDQGDAHAAEQLLPLVYSELRRLATRKMAQESPDHTLQPTALVHEAYVRLVGSDKAQQWDSRGHFYAAAAEAMRRILIEDARRKQTMKRGGGLVRWEFDEEFALSEPREQADLLALDEALTKLAAVDPEAAQLVKLRFFAGLSVEEAAHSSGISPRTAKRNWSYARAWLRREMERG